jgi:uncharacterized protein (DUF4415 family)
MTERKRNTQSNWSDRDDAPEWPDEVWDRAQISVGGRVIREATGTLTKRGRPPMGDAPKQQVTLRLPRNVIEHFRDSGAGWQTRIGDVLERYVGGKAGEHGRSSTIADPTSNYTVDDLPTDGTTDRDRVNMNDDWEVRYWTKKFGVTKEDLGKAVRQVGPDREGVERYFRGR